MKVVGVIAEFNPFHNGHAYFLDCAKKTCDASHIIAVMSPNAVQRGEVACVEKHVRARAALMCGADLVLELPAAYAVSGAERFALGGVEILNSTGCCDILCYGSESADVNAHQKYAGYLLSPEFNEDIKNYLSEGISFASARSLAVSSKFGEGAQEILKNPNDILGIEYCKAIKKLNSGIIPAAIRRIGAGHDCDKAENGIASASYIRENENFTDYIPSSIKPLYREEQNAGRFPAKTDKIDRIILYKLQSMTLEDIAALPDISEGLENKIYAAAQVSRSVSQLIENVKSKRYSHARIRRILLCAALGIDKTLTFTPIPYIRVLGFNKKGRELLSEINKKSKLPVLSTTAQLKEYGGKFFEAECRTTALFGLALPKVLPANYELITPIVTL